MDIKADLKTLNKSILFTQSMDTPDSVYVVVPEANPPTLLPTDQVRLETYVRLKSLPIDVMRLVLCITEARSISNKIAEAVPYLPKANIAHYPSGAVEMKWRLDDGGVFAVVLHGFSFSLEFENEFRVERRGKIQWHFNGPKLPAQHGDFKSVEELVDFMGKCFVQT